MPRASTRRAEAALTIFVILAAIPALAIAGETVNYTYDAKGRLVKVERTGTANNNVTTNYAFDKADNRTNKTTTGSPYSGPP